MELTRIQKEYLLKRLAEQMVLDKIYEAEFDAAYLGQFDDARRLADHLFDEFVEDTQSEIVEFVELNLHACATYIMNSKKYLSVHALGKRHWFDISQWVDTP